MEQSFLRKILMMVMGIGKVCQSIRPIVFVRSFYSDGILPYGTYGVDKPPKRETTDSTIDRDHKPGLVPFPFQICRVIVRQLDTEKGP